MHENSHNRSEIENTGFQNGDEIDVMLHASTMNQYENMEHNNEYHYPLTNGNMSTLKNSSIYTLTSPYIN